MEILINQKGREYLDLTEVKRPIEAMNLPSFCYIEEYKDADFDLAYYCTNCGSHLQGIWKKQYLRLYHVGHACTSVCKETHDCSKVKVLIDELNEKYSTPMAQENNKELLELARLSHCPICGAKLKREDGYCFASIYKRDDPLFTNIETSEFSYMNYARPRAANKEKETQLQPRFLPLG